jgi:hypothetical protein
VGVTPDPKPPVKTAPVAKKASTEWVITPNAEEGSADWLNAVKEGVDAILQLAQTADGVASVFKNNRVTLDKVKALDEGKYADIMTSFSTTKKALTKE